MEDGVALGPGISSRFRNRSIFVATVANGTTPIEITYHLVVATYCTLLTVAAAWNEYNAEALRLRTIVAAGTCARLCHAGKGELEQIQGSLDAIVNW